MNEPLKKSPKTSYYIRFAAGAYLLYTAYSLNSDWAEVKPEQKLAIGAAILLFAFVGFILCLLSALSLNKLNKMQTDDEEDTGPVGSQTDHRLFSTKEFEERYTYEGNDLGAVWTEDKTSFRLWAPTAEQVSLKLYHKGSEEEAAGTGEEEDLIRQVPMKRDVKGTWTVEISGDLNRTYYTYEVTAEGRTREAVDPYARATGVNGNRGMILNLSVTDPEGFSSEQRPKVLPPTDAIIYELHVRDFSADDSSGMSNKGKFLAFTEQGTRNKHGEATGIDYLKELGITHVHLLPVFDYATVDEAKSLKQGMEPLDVDRYVNEGGNAKEDEPQYNWGYDPKNYNVPEGSYATDPFDGAVRVKEFKQLVQALHARGIRVIMDVVYNHTYSLEDSAFQKCVPGYYYRKTSEGSYSDASACGNELASERSMVRRFIVDSVVYWAKEYYIDGFRFDLMGVHDCETMNQVRRALDQIDPGILLYGEGWTAGASPLPEEQRAVKANMSKLDTRIAAFSDDMRDGIKGSVFIEADQGFVNGGEGKEEMIKFGITASTPHDQVDYNRTLSAPWAKEPSQTVNYASAHDNLTLWDKLTLSAPDSSREDRLRMNLLSAAIVLTSQGIPLIHAGEELLRSKPLDESGRHFDENSYRSPDRVNSIKWNDRTVNKEVLEYYKGLIAFRKAHKALRLERTEEIKSCLRFLDMEEPKLIGYVIDAGKTDTTLCLIFNGNKDEKQVQLPPGSWKVYGKGTRAGIEVLETLSGTIMIEPISAMILAKE